MIDENKLIEERPEWLNPNCIGREEYNKGWNDCNRYWCNTIKSQPKVNEWIPVEERLPEGYDDAEIELLISTKEEYPDALFEETGFALYYPGTKQFRSVYGDRLDITEIVTAWQYLPAPYDMWKKV